MAEKNLMAHRQEALNVILAQILERQGLVAAPEQIRRVANVANVRLPDVLVDFLGLRLAIEAEYDSTADAQNKAFEKAQSRVTENVAHIGAAVVYPGKLRNADWAKISELLSKAKIKFAIVNEVNAPETQLNLFLTKPEAPFFVEGTVSDLIDSLRRSYEQLVRDDTLTRAVEMIEAQINEATAAMSLQPASAHRMARTLGISDGEEQSSLTLDQQGSVNRIGALILINALIFQEVLSQKDSRVETLQNYRLTQDALSSIRDQWHLILSKINYYPIFSTAHEILLCLSAESDLQSSLLKLADTALKIVACRASLRHDLAGRIYHRLLEEAKYLGAYYTAIPSASLLLKLALAPEHYTCDWSDIESIRNLRVADLACGTGTLLMASADVVLDNYVRACVPKGKVPELTKLQHALVEDVIYGFDVLPSAVHLTASTLTLRVPETPVNTTHLYKMPLGGSDFALGTLEFLDKFNAAGTLFGHTEQMSGKGKKTTLASIPTLDLCVMNPPFTRSVGDNLLFGNLPESERLPMQKKLKKLVQSKEVPASITAGLGSVFAALGGKHIRESGTLALVLPKALICGPSWKPTRDMIAESYFVDYIISSHQAKHWNFSENTSLSEVLLVARKSVPKVGLKARTVYLNLWRQPRNSIEAMSIAREVAKDDLPDLLTAPAGKEIVIGDRKFGEAHTIDWLEIRDTLWSLPASYATFPLNKMLFLMLKGKLRLPGEQENQEIPLCSLTEIGTLGFDRRDIHDGFTLAASKTQYPALWGHASDIPVQLRQSPNKWLMPRSVAAKGRNFRDADDLWKKSGHILLTERFRVNNMPISAVYVDVPVLSNVWWPLRLNDGVPDEAAKALVLWLNSSIGMMALLGHRVETEGSFIAFKKPLLAQMPVLNVAKISKPKLSKLAAAFDSVAKQNLLPLPEMSNDPIRIKIDSAIEKSLGIATLSNLRTMLAREPIICNKMTELMPPAP